MAELTAIQRAKERYETTRDKFEQFRVKYTSDGGEHRIEVATKNEYASAVVDLVLTGLDEWIKASAAASAISEARAEKDHRDQRLNRWVIVGLTVGLLITAVAQVVAGQKAAPIVLPAPVVNVPAVPVTLTIPAPTPSPEAPRFPQAPKRGQSPLLP